MFNLSAIVIAGCVGLTRAVAGPPVIALIIDDIGYAYENGRAAVELQQPFAYAVLPFSPHAETLAHLANTLDKDVMVHLPMEADNDNHLLGRGALRLDMSRNEIESTLLESIAAVPHAIGINNHMGSRLTQEPAHMGWLMHAIHDRGGLFFVDSRTTSHSIALKSAKRASIVSTFRDVFLDNVKTRRHVQGQIDALVAQAKRNGHALGIAHPHPVTIEVLRNWRPSQAGVRLIKISDYVLTHQVLDSTPSRPRTSLRAAASECGDKGYNADPAENPDTHRQWPEHARGLR
jgi:polysaccharide deacetylase 2 family uncharacterized protein YibQ